MIKGNIEDGLYPIIWVEVAGSFASKKLAVLVDTGFNADIGLHHSEAAKLGLEIIDFARVDYADGKSLREPVCSARIRWHGEWKNIEVILSNDEESAVGTRLLQGSLVTMNFVKNRLTIKEIAESKRRKN